jgi:septum site-determining protein MinC
MHRHADEGARLQFIGMQVACRGSASRKLNVSAEVISIKGIRHGLLVTLEEGGWDGLLAELERRLETSPSFFKGGRVSLDVGDLSLKEEDLRTIRDLLNQHDVTLHAVVSTEQETETAAQGLGLVIDLGLDRRPVQERSVDPSEPRLGEAVLWQRTLRSGQTIRHPGHVIVIGDVNPGAEIVAGGHVVIWGRLRGTVHAGASGDEEATICALDMSPTQLRIAGHITRSPEERRRDPAPEVAAVQDGQIVAMPWK